MAYGLPSASFRDTSAYHLPDGIPDRWCRRIRRNCGILPATGGSVRLRQTFHGHRYIAFIIDVVVGVNIIAVHLNRCNADTFCQRCNLAGCFLHGKGRFAGIQITYFLRNPFRSSGPDIHIDPVGVCVGQKITFGIFHFKITVAEKGFPAVCPCADGDLFAKFRIAVDDDLPGRKDPA